MKQQTAVEWLIEQIIKYDLVPKNTNPDNVLFHKAKAMEKAEKDKQYARGFKDGSNHIKIIHNL